MRRFVKWFLRVALGLLVFMVLAVGVLAGLIINDSINGEKASEHTNVTYQGPDGLELIGYLAEPEGEGPHPSVLLIHEWWGLNEGMPILADALASEGYTVLAVDAYRNKLTSFIPRAIWLVLSTPQKQIHADVDAGLDYLLSLDSVDKDRVASMGFCFGGGHSLQLGMRQSQNMALTIMYYGAMETNPDLLRPLTEGQPVLGVFGADDQSIPTAEVLEFEAALNSLNIENEITIYEGVGHGFLTEDNYNQPGAAGDAWQQTLAFLERNFKN